MTKHGVRRKREDQVCQVPRIKTSDACGLPAVGRCTLDWSVHVCREHFRSAKSNGFLPRFYK